MAGPQPYQDAARAPYFDEAPVAMIVIDRDGIVRMWNRAAEALTGWSAAEAIGRLPLYVPEEQVDGFHKRHAAAFEKADIPDLTVRRRHRDGRTIDVQIARSVLHDAAGQPFAILGVLTDVTRQRRDEDEQRRSEANLRTLIERSPDAIVVHRHGIAIFAN